MVQPSQRHSVGGRSGGEILALLGKVFFYSGGGGVGVWSRVSVGVLGGSGGAFFWDPLFSVHSGVNFISILCQYFRVHICTCSIFGVWEYGFFHGVRAESG